MIWVTIILGLLQLLLSWLGKAQASGVKLSDADKKHLQEMLDKADEVKAVAKTMIESP